MMNENVRLLQTRRGAIRFPAYFPVTTFGNKYPLDGLVRPYLPRLAQAAMVSYYYARQMNLRDRPNLPLLVDSGGFASLFNNACVEIDSGLGVIRVKTDDGVDAIYPNAVLELQEQIGEVAFSLDFPIPPGMNISDAVQRMDLTIANAQWALKNRRRKDLPLYACVQAWDAQSARDCTQAYIGAGFDGLAIGGLVPRAKNLDLLKSIVENVRSEAGDLPLHVFGIGKPDLVELLFKLGVDSVDSSSYVKMAAEGRVWNNPNFRIEDPAPSDRMKLALINLATATRRGFPLSVIKMTWD